MKSKSLRPLLDRLSKSKHASVKKLASDMLVNTPNEEEEQIIDPKLQVGHASSALKEAPKDIADVLISPAFKELEQDEGQVTSFGKTASAFIADVIIKDLSKKTQEDIAKIYPTSSKKLKAVQYGMVVEELIHKVDPHNFKVAKGHVEEELTKKGKKFMGDKFQEKVGDKYILLLNDCIVDGHHFLALAKLLNITCSLKVLDLTPLRFQGS